jgi:hypothetical protein
MLRRALGAAAAALTLMAVAATSDAAAAPHALSDSHVRRPAVSTKVARVLGAGGELRGMALNDISPPRALDATVVDFPRMAADGITSVTAYVYLYLRSPNSNLFMAGVNTPTDAELQVVGAAAKASGLKLVLMPVLLNNTTSGFRGDYQPTNPALFFANYTKQLVHYADLGTQLGASMLYVGSENNDIVPFTDLWRSTIAQVRQHFSGALSYMSTAYSALDVHFWDALDVAAISPYFSLGTDRVPTYDRMLSAWTHDHLPYVARVAAKIHKPIVFGELGYHSQAGTYEGPAKGGALTDLPTPEAQGNAYAALLDALRTAPDVYGVTWFRWGSATSALDTSYSPAGKPAECELAKRWSTDSTVLSLASSPLCDLSTIDSLSG